MKPILLAAVWRFWPVFLAATAIAIQNLRYHFRTEELVLDFFQWIPLWLLWGFTVLWALWRGAGNGTPWWANAGLVFLTFCWAEAPDYWFAWRKVPATVLFASTGEGVGIFSMDFRQDGTYRFTNSGGIGATFFTGRYTRCDSIIWLDHQPVTRAAPPS